MRKRVITENGAEFSLVVCWRCHHSPHPTPTTTTTNDNDDDDGAAALLSAAARMPCESLECPLHAVVTLVNIPTDAGHFVVRYGGVCQ